ncbi:MAG: NYN domain-containing protein [Bacillota bacterium]|uniref:NYN domain-containing protein n=1 Tax=Desulfurispora thermophila TaxID=265470 RepID=UPI00035D3841|nr:NYN domain-containing protein [Desulfurispora thermophila]
MKEYLLVDGYNIIHAWPDLQKIKEESLEHARDKLVEQMINYAARSGEHVIVVFDAHQVKNSLAHSEVVAGVEIYYTAEGETADAVIERMAGELKDKGRVHVATSDAAEQTIILGRGAYRMTPGELKKRLQSVQKDTQRFYQTDLPAERYLENRLVDNIRQRLEQMRRGQ